MDAFVGKWKLEEADAENFDNYMVALGVGMIKRGMAKRATPTQDISKQSDEELTIKTCTGSTIGITTTLNFKLGQEFDETTMDGRKVKTTVTLEDGKLVQTQPGTTECKITREIADDKYVMTLEIPEKQLVVKRIYARQ